MIGEAMTTNSSNKSKGPQNEGLFATSLFGITGLVTFFRKLSTHAANAAELPRL
jgi:hypothetical protein